MLILMALYGLFLLLSVPLMLYIVGCALHFLYVLIKYGELSRFSPLPVTVGMFFVGFLGMLFYSLHEFQPPPISYFPDVDAITAGDRMSDEEITITSVMGGMAVGAVASLAIGLPVDLILKFIKHIRRRAKLTSQVIIE